MRPGPRHLSPKRAKPPTIGAHDLVAEMAVLGGILQDKGALRIAERDLPPQALFDARRHLPIFSAILAVHRRGNPVDLVTVAEELQQTGQYESVGSAYLASLIEAVPSAANTPHYIGIVLEKWRCRQLQDAFTRGAERARENGHDASAILADFWELTRELDEEHGPVLPTLDAPGPVLSASRLNTEPIPTGLQVFNDRLRGGMRPGRTLMIGGTPGVGKTSLLLQLARAAAEAGCAVACLMVDEGREPAIVRVGQQLGYVREAIETMVDEAAAGIERDLGGAILRFPDPDGEADVTIEGVAEALVQAFPSHRKVLAIDSVQRVRTRGYGGVKSEREGFTQAAQVARRMATHHGLTVLFTSEVSRGWYRSKREEERSADLASFAGARLEYWADVCVTLRGREDESGVVDLKIPKNRLGFRTPFVLALDQKRALFVPAEDTPGAAEAAEAEARQKVIDKAVEGILQALAQTPDLTRAQLAQVLGVKSTTFSQALGQARASGMVIWKKVGRSILHRLAEVAQ